MLSVFTCIVYVTSYVVLTSRLRCRRGICLNETETKQLRRRAKKSGGCGVDHEHEDRDPKALIQFFWPWLISGRDLRTVQIETRLNAFNIRIAMFMISAIELGLEGRTF